MNNSNLKPVVFVKGQYGYTAQNTTQQIMLLKALKITQDPKRLREIIGVKTVADVYRTLDKIAMRKEYHASLAKHGVSFDYIVGNLKGVIDTADKPTEKLMGLSILMKSIGLDKYDETATGGGSWEDALANIPKEKREAQLKTIEYEVIAPEVPEEIKKKREKELKEGRSLYE